MVQGWQSGLPSQTGGALLFSLVFLFLWRESRIVYFGLWSVAWGVQAAALACEFRLLYGYQPAWLLPYAILQFAFVILLTAAARAGFSGSFRNWRSPLVLLGGSPIVAGAIVAAGRFARIESYFTLQALALCFAYFYNWKHIHAGGAGGRLFRWSLLALAAVSLEYAVVLWWLRGVRYLEYSRLVGFALEALLAFSAMAMWIESQNDRVRELGSELDHVRRESALTMDLDRLTGLLNQSALAKRMENQEGFQGVVAVCDMDNFKDVNDRYGHLAGDEILRNIGNLLRSSIRHEDEAFRWGGDEFVILFHNQRSEVIQTRMREIEHRLRGFQVRGHGVLPISFSWGVCEAAGRPLRECLDEADREMYAFKRQRPARKKV